MNVWADVEYGDLTANQKNRVWTVAPNRFNNGWTITAHHSRHPVTHWWEHIPANWHIIPMGEPDASQP